ncbi:MAG: MFS transporter [Gammaproteobacteria bacterium]|nr:MAG: MFS transporter [Gammaproteobacteria bacterium]
MTEQRPVPYWRLSGFYLIYFAALGSIIPYWSIYLQSIGFSAADIGLLVAILLGTKIFSPNIWSWISEKNRQPVVMIRLASFLSVLAFSGIFLGNGFWWIATIMLLFSFFWNATLPQFEAVTLFHLKEDSHRYSLIRIWGSVGFIAIVVVIGEGLEHYSIAHLPALILVLLAAIWVVSLVVPPPPLESIQKESRFWLPIAKSPQILAFFIVCFLIQASHGPYYVFYTISLDQQGYSGGATGMLWALAVVAEVLLFVVMHRLLKKYSLRFILLTGLCLTALRWFLIAYGSDSLAILLLAQLLHAASFGSNHAVAIHFLHRHFKGQNQLKGQALYGAVSFGLGGVIGSLYSGYLWDVGGAETIYLIAALISLLALFIGWKWVEIESGK